MSSYPLDRISYEIGMINCFIEMVACGVKPLAISPPIEPENLPVLEEVSRELSEGFGTKYYVDLEMMITDIQSADFTRGKHSIFYYKDDAVIRRYKELKEQVAALTAEGRYSAAEQFEGERSGMEEGDSFREDRTRQKEGGGFTEEMLLHVPLPLA